MAKVCEFCGKKLGTFGTYYRTLGNTEVVACVRCADLLEGKNSKNPKTVSAFCSFARQTLDGGHLRPELRKTLQTELENAASRMGIDLSEMPSPPAASASYDQTKPVSYGTDDNESVVERPVPISEKDAPASDSVPQYNGSSRVPYIGILLSGIVSVILGIVCFCAYTGIQNAAATTAYNVQALADIVKFGFGSLLLVIGLIAVFYAVAKLISSKNK